MPPTSYYHQFAIQLSNPNPEDMHKGGGEREEVGGAEGAAVRQGLQARADRQLHRAGAPDPAAGGAETGKEEPCVGPAGVCGDLRPAPAAAKHHTQQALAHHGAGTPP